MELRRSGVPLLFLYALVTATTMKEKEVISIIGNTAELRCIYAPGEKFVLSNLRVFWQTTDKSCSVVHSFSSGHENESQQCIHFRNRTQLFQDKLEDGNFSLLLLNVSVRDENTYRCVVQKKDLFFKVIYSTDVVLKIAANSSKPEISPNNGSAVMLSCNYSQGYPKPKVYWINGTDNSLLHPSLSATIQDTDGTYSVFSTLTINTTSDVTVGCIIENELLQQNQSVFYSRNISLSTTPSSLLALSEPGAKAGIVIAIAILVVSVVLLIYWLCKRESSRWKLYADVQQNEERAQYNTPI